MTNNNIIEFQFEGKEVRTMKGKNGEPWFVAKDICNVLEIKNTTDALKRLDSDERARFNLGRQGETNFVNEPGLYTLILGSRKPQAKAFKRWITHEVIPSIRKTGGYVSNDDMFIDTYLPFADEQTRQLFKGTLETVRKQNEEIKRMKPKEEYFDTLVERNLLTNFRDTAKELKIKQNEFIGFLLDNGYVYRDTNNRLKPYSQYTPDLFEVKEFVNRKTKGIGVQTLITPKGRETFRLLLHKTKLI